MTETVSTRVPNDLFELMLGEASFRGISLSALLREITKKHYGFEKPKSGKTSLLYLKRPLDPWPKEDQVLSHAWRTPIQGTQH